MSVSRTVPWYSAGMATGQRRAIPLDTSPTARERQVKAWIAMGSKERVRLAASMSDDVRRVAAEGHAARSSRADATAKRSG